jgi:hypothetical protein
VKIEENENPFDFGPNSAKLELEFEKEKIINDISESVFKEI